MRSSTVHLSVEIAEYFTAAENFATCHDLGEISPVSYLNLGSLKLVKILAKFCKKFYCQLESFSSSECIACQV